MEARRSAASTSNRQEMGVTPPLGFFDPLGLSKFDDPEAKHSGSQAEPGGD